MSVTNKAITQRVLTISWPILLEVTLASLFGMVNMIVLGNYSRGLFSSEVNVAAIGLVNSPLTFILATVQALGVGGTTLIARAYGAKEYRRLGHILKHTLLLGMLLSTLVIGLALYYQESVMRFMEAEPAAIEASRTYYQFVMIGLWFNCVTALLSASIRGVGETKVPMQINIMANAVNVVVAYTLVNGWLHLPELGMNGAGIATLLSNSISAVLLIYYISSGRSAIKVKWLQRFALDRTMMGAILRFGLPSTGEQFILRFSLILYTKIIASLGTAYMAAHQIALNILSLSITPAMALGIAASTLVGQSLGSQDPVLADRYGRRSTQFGLIIGCIMGCLFFLTRGVMGALYTNNAQVVSYVAIPLVYMAIMTPFQLVQLVQVGALRGVGDTVFPMLSTGFSVLCVRVVLSYIFVKQLGWGLSGAWAAVVCDQLLRSALITWRYRQGKWQTIQA